VFQSIFASLCSICDALKDTTNGTLFHFLIKENEGQYPKLCFEKTDFDTHAVVSVVTNQTSDDANGCNIEGNTVWLQGTRVNNSFSFHYSVDGQKFYMARFFNLPVDPVVKVGLVAQAPTGKGGYRCFEDFSIRKMTVKNIRFGE